MKHKIKLPNPDTFYSKISNKIRDAADFYQAWLRMPEQARRNQNGEIVREHLGKYWREFAEFKARQEHVDWFNFVVREHNLWMFVLYVFKQYPETMVLCLQEAHKNSNKT